MNTYVLLVIEVIEWKRTDNLAWMTKYLFLLGEDEKQNQTELECTYYNYTSTPK